MTYTTDRPRSAYQSEPPAYYLRDDHAVETVLEMAMVSPYLACDIETQGLGALAFKLTVIAISNDTYSCVLDALNPRHVAAAREALALTPKIIFHNSEFDVPPLVAWGAMRTQDIAKIEDTLIMARMAFTDAFQRKSLDAMEKLFLPQPEGYRNKSGMKELAKLHRIPMKEAFRTFGYSTPAMVGYAGWDAILTSRLYPKIHQAVVGTQLNHSFGRYGCTSASEAMDVVAAAQVDNRVMLHRSVKGLAVDNDRITREQDRLLGVQSDLEQVLVRQYGMSEASNPNQLITVLDKEDALPSDYPRTEKTGKPSTAADNLEKLDHPAARAFNEWKKSAKLLGYITTAVDIANGTDGRIHPTVSIMKAVTGRMSYSSPALQQFIWEAREAVLGDNENLTSIDWSQIEPVVIANLANDTAAIELYEGDELGDLYEIASKLAGIDRKSAKEVILATLYGEGIIKLASQLGCSPQEAQAIQSAVSKAMERTFRLAGWASKWSSVIGQTWTMAGRIIQVPLDAGYKGTNYTTQGSAYDLVSYALGRIYADGLTDHLYLAMHDELVVSECAAEAVADIMRTAPPRMVELIGRTPKLRVDIAPLGDRWRTSDYCDVTDTVLRKDGSLVGLCAQCK